MTNSQLAKHASRIATVKVADSPDEAKINCATLDELGAVTSRFDIAGIDYSIEFSQPKRIETRLTF